MPLVCAAQNTRPAPEFVPDRPDFTDSSHVVGHHVVHLEAGVRLEHSDGGTRQVTAPGVMIRAGFGSRFELRFADDGFISQSVSTPAGHVRTNGHSDVELGAKVKLLKGEAAGLHVALLPFVSLPTASHGLGSGGYDPGIKAAWSRDLPKGIGLSGNVNASSATEGPAKVWTREVSLSVGHALSGAWSAYWEAYGAARSGRCACAVDAGLALALGPNRQIDLEAGRGLGSHAQNWFIGAGFSVRRLSGNSR